MERLQRMFAGTGGGLGPQPPDSQILDTYEQVYVSSPTLLKMLKHGHEIERTFLQQLRQTIHDPENQSTMGDADPPQTLRQLTDSDLTQQHLGVTLPALDEGVHFELKTGNINHMNKTMDDINEKTEIMKQIHEAMSAPIGTTTDIDEVDTIDELEAELKELEGADLEDNFYNQLLPPLYNYVPARQPLYPTPQNNKAEEDELAALQVEIAL